MSALPPVTQSEDSRTRRAEDETPKIGAMPAVLRAFLQAKIPYESTVRTRRASTWTKASRYREADQWLEPSTSGDPTRTPHWSSIRFGSDDEDAIPTPVQPEIIVHLSNEAARLGKPEYEPYVRPQGENWGAKEREGAQITERLLQARLQDINWEEIEADGDMEMPLWGQAIYKSYREEDYLNKSRIPSRTAMACPRHPNAAQPAAPGEMGEMMPQEPCDFRLTKPDLTDNIAAQMVAKSPDSVAGEAISVEDGGEGTFKFKAVKCPQCMDSPDLVEYMPTMAEAASEKDSFGRPLGDEIPRVDAMIKNVSPYDLFPQSMGIGLKPREWQWWVECYAIPVSVVARRFKNGHKVKAENAQAIMQWHPVAGERSIYDTGGYSDAGVFRDFVRVKEYHERPSLKFPLGRSIAMAGDEVLLDSTFLVPSQTQKGETYERVHLELIPWEPRPHESWGLSMSELLFSCQEDINERLSMESDQTGRMGMVGWSARRGMDLDTVALEGGGYNGKVIEFDTDPAAPSAEPKMIGGASMPEAIPFVEFKIQAMGRISGTNDVEAGSPPQGVTAALAMQFLGEKSGERRGIRVRRKRKALERLWTHTATVMYHSYLEPREIEFRDDDGRYKKRAYEGTQMHGQVQVRIEAESEHDSTLNKQQKIMDLVAAGFYDMTNPQVKDKLAKKLDAPRDIEATLEVQGNAAQREFTDLLDLGRSPVVDTSLDDHAQHHDQHGQDMLGEKWRDLEDAAEFYDLMPFLWGWDTRFQTEQPAVEQMLKLARQPFALEFQILALWNQMLAEAGIDPLTFEDERKKALATVLRFRAHDEAHTWIFQGKLQQAQAGQAVAAAPGGDATAAGTMPTEDTMVAPQPGATVPAGTTDAQGAGQSLPAAPLMQ